MADKLGELLINATERNVADAKVGVVRVVVTISDC